MFYITNRSPLTGNGVTASKFCMTKILAKKARDLWRPFPVWRSGLSAATNTYQVLHHGMTFWKHPLPDLNLSPPLTGNRGVPTFFAFSAWFSVASGLLWSHAATCVSIASPSPLTRHTGSDRKLNRKSPPWTGSHSKVTLKVKLNAFFLFFKVNFNFFSTFQLILTLKMVEFGIPATVMHSSAIFVSDHPLYGKL